MPETGCGAYGDIHGKRGCDWKDPGSNEYRYRQHAIDSMVTGNMKDRLVSGDKVRILRNDRGKEYYILEIIGKPYQTGG